MTGVLKKLSKTSMSAHHDEITQSILRTYAPLAHQSILEIGCGDGRVTRFLTGSPKLLVALDPDVSRLNKAKQNVPEAKYLSASGANLPFGNASFDLVVFSLSLHHHPDCSAALTEAARALKPNGYILVLEPTGGGEMEPIWNLFHDETAVLAEAQKAIEKCGLTTVGSEIFTTSWHYEDAQHLARWLFEFYGASFEEQKHDQVLRLLGKRVEESPLALDDLTLITCLGK